MKGSKNLFDDLSTSLTLKLIESELRGEEMKEPPPKKVAKIKNDKKKEKVKVKG